MGIGTEDYIKEYIILAHQTAQFCYSFSDIHGFSIIQKFKDSKITLIQKFQDSKIPRFEIWNF